MNTAVSSLLFCRSHLKRTLVSKLRIFRETVLIDFVGESALIRALCVYQFSIGRNNCKLSLDSLEAKYPFAEFLCIGGKEHEPEIVARLTVFNLFLYCVDVKIFMVTQLQVCQPRRVYTPRVKE